VAWWRKRRSASMAGEELVAERLVSLLTGMGIRASAQNTVVKLARATPEISIKRVELSQPQPPVWIAHADIRFSLNPDRPETHIDDCATGWAETQEEAIESAAQAWTKITAPPVFSLLQHSPDHGADWFPLGNAAGLPGWHVFAGPYGFRGDPEGGRLLEDHLQRHPLLPLLSEPIVRGFRRPYLNYVKLYRGYSGSEWLSDGLINGVRDQALTDKLLGLRWPEIRQFASATLFAIAYSEPGSAPGIE
jgi:Family of unknown function (DUF6348)